MKLKTPNTKAQPQKLTWWQIILYAIAIMFVFNILFGSSDRINELESQVEELQDKVDCLDEYISDGLRGDLVSGDVFLLSGC